MFLVIPELVLEDGHCSYCIQGESGMEKHYLTLSDNPDQLCKLWRRENAKALHVVDLDSYRGKDNSKNIELLEYIINSVDILIQLSTYERSIEKLRGFLNKGIYRIIIDDIIIEEEKAIKAMIKKYTASRVALNIEVLRDKAIFGHEESSMSDLELARHAKEIGINRAYYYDRLLPLQHDLSRIINFAEETRMRITVVEGANTHAELMRLKDKFSNGIDSVTIGKALYENRFPCQKIWRMIEAELEPGIE
jgi:phosphoribosylformimino-5-aminoimidazole carboxamide ribotide isomerase